MEQDRALGKFTIHFGGGTSITIPDVTRISARSFDLADKGVTHRLSDGKSEINVVNLNVERTEWIPNEF